MTGDAGKPAGPRYGDPRDLSDLSSDGSADAPAYGDRRRWRALQCWMLLVAGSFGVGAVLHGLGVLTIDHLPPLHGHFRVLTVTLLPAAALAAVAVPALPVLVTRGGFGRALLVTYGTALAWTVLLAVSADGLAAPFTHPEEYQAVLPTVGGDPIGWLGTFTERLPGYPTHVRGHPPLPVLIVWALAALGAAGPLWAALLVVAVGCSAAVAIGLTVRELAGEHAARRALPYLALSPAAVWIATSMDALFAGVGAWGVALLALAGSRARGRIALGVAAGVLLGALPYLSYGLVPYLLIPVAIAVILRLPAAVVFAALAGAATVSAGFAAGGFLWPAGVLATHAEWAADPGAARPYLYFLFANLGVLALLTGPATAAGLAQLAPIARLGQLLLRQPGATTSTTARRATPLVAGAALIAVLALDVSGVTRGEVERIWVPYALWIGIAAGHAGGRRWLAAQAATGLLLQGLVVSPW